MAQNAVVLQILLDDRNSAKVTGQLKKRFNAVEASADKATAVANTGFKKAAKGAGNLRAVTGNANQVMFAFGDAVNDAAFAGGNLAQIARFAGNNVTFAAESFSNIVARTGSFNAAVRALFGSLMGPGGLILGLNVVITAINLFGDSLFGASEEARALEEDINDVTAAIDETISRLEDFDAFSEGPMGDIEKGQARVREITEDIAEQQERLTKAREREARILVLKQAAQFSFTKQQAEELESLRQQQKIFGTSEEIQENIQTLNEERIRQSIKLVRLGESLADQDVKDAQAQQEATRQLERQRELLELIRQAKQEAAPTGPSGDIISQQIDVGMPDTAGGIKAAAGSVADLRNQLQGLRNFRELIDPNSEGFEILTEKIKETEQALRDAQGTGTQSMSALEGAVDLVGSALIRAVVQGRKLDDILASLARQLASRALITGLKLLLNVGSGGFFSTFFAGFQHGTDAGFPGMGIAGERGPELVVAPPFSSVITNENIERLTRLRQQARLGAENISSVSTSGMQQAVRDAVIEGMARVRLSPVVRVSDIEQGLDERQEVKVLIGNG